MNRFPLKGIPFEEIMQKTENAVVVIGIKKLNYVYTKTFD
jgi:hypothetical protein